MNTQENSFEILLAEDSAAGATLVREALREHSVPCMLYAVRDGVQAIAFIEDLDNHSHAQGLDLLLLDMNLPGRGGEDILRTLRSTERFAQTPGIVMTSSVSPYVREVADKHAALHYFQKPSSLAQFMELGGIVKQVLDKTHPGSGPAQDGGGNAR